MTNLAIATPNSPAARAAHSCGLLAVCPAAMTGWSLREADGLITAISLVGLPPFLATAMHPVCATTLQAWAARLGIACDLVTYVELLTEGNQVDAHEAAERASRASAFSPVCQSEALAIIALERLITTQEGTV
ncbi:hypothetical protein WNZ14_14415 [Hoeflea sp. AS60]|uniref:hypothetical protein n=1 Tax=Hoeflea sp. AS60 TaxID=3135780 RepID=UPI003182B737